MSQSDDIVVDGDLPVIQHILPLDKFRVEVRWKLPAEITQVVDLAAEIFTFKAYAPLRDSRDLFEGIHVADDGNAIAWGDDDILMPATAVERLAAEVMTGERLRVFMRDARLTRDGLAAQLGVSRRLVGYWLEGQTIPRYIFLACQALDGRIRDRNVSTETTGVAAFIPRSSTPLALRETYRDFDPPGTNDMVDAPERSR